MSKKIIISILIILLAALAVFAFEKYKPPVTLTTPSPSTSTTPSEINPNWSQYQDTQDGFSIAFPPDYLLTQNTEVPASDISLGVPAATINLPDSYFEGTNLGEASLTIRIGTSSADVASCVANSEYFVGQRQINGENFAQYNFIGAAAGNIYDSVLLRNSHANKCYEIEILMHSGNIGNYTPGTVKEFNHDEILDNLERIANTFRFIVFSP